MTGPILKPNVGHVLDTIWQWLPENHYLHQLHPSKKPAPHEDFLMFGRAVLEECKKRGVVFPCRLEGKDYEAWERLVGAWSEFQRKAQLSRTEASRRAGLDPSNLSNFLNGKRPLTPNSMEGFALLIGIQTFDLRPELGAAFARTAERNAKRKLKLVDDELGKLRAQIGLIVRDSNVLEPLLGQIESMRKLLR
jgi:transcriptional regulator with XRE-family HTH domain